MFLLRTAFWLLIAILLIPVDAETRRQAEAAGAVPVAAGDALAAAGDAIADAGGFCDRNPRPCEIGRRVGVTIAIKAEVGARLVADLLRDTVSGGSADAAAGTLTAEDRAEPWRAPAAADSI